MGDETLQAVGRTGNGSIYCLRNEDYKCCVQHAEQNVIIFWQ